MPKNCEKRAIESDDNRSTFKNKRSKLNKESWKTNENVSSPIVFHQMGVDSEEESSEVSSANLGSIFTDSSDNENTLVNFDIYSDSSSIKLNRTIMNSSQSSNSTKGRSPLAIVSNNNSTVQSHQSNIGNEATSSKKLVNAMLEEKFFLYRKRRPRNMYDEDVFNRLSDEMLLHIFKWLPKKTLMRCCQVNKRFNQVVKDESLWVRLDLAGRCLRPGAMSVVLYRGVVILRMAQARILEPIFDDTIEPDFRSKLQFLDLSMCTISIPSLQQFLSHCRNLKKLSLENVVLDETVCKEIAANTNIEALNLTMCEGINSYSILQIFKNCQKLHSLNISWTSLSRQGIEALVTHISPNLLRLNIAGCRKGMTESILKQLVSRCPELLELDISDSPLLTTGALPIICKLAKLEYLSLSRCYGINVQSYAQLKSLETLQYLDIFGMVNESATQVLENTFPDVGINRFMHSSVARPTVGTRRTSIWGLRTRD